MIDSKIFHVILGAVLFHDLRHQSLQSRLQNVTVPEDCSDLCTVHSFRHPFLLSSLTSLTTDYAALDRFVWSFCCE